MSFGEKIKELRQQYNLTQKEFAAKLSLTAANIGAWEKDLKKPSYDVLLQIAKEFNVSLDWLCGLSENVNIKINKWSDIINAFLALANSKLNFAVDVEKDAAMIKFSKYYVSEDLIDQLECVKSEKLEMCYKRPNYKTDGLNSYEIEQQQFENDIYYPENPIYSFLRDWNKMTSLLETQSIDKELFELWLNKQLEKYSYLIMKEQSTASIDFLDGDTECPQ